ncbi:hypothetical protein MLD38_036976 [Melastoma candidum]|uniref:Uncharacterized protein n=1 Tax=Melastoma candidum TaxID=119954 RepID=A0ACB9LMB6_9MYRT|nr:hypothetical protein MLD38_036976 [Melastoma candidum]
MMMMFKSAVYRGDELLGEVEVYPPPLQRPGGGGDEVEEKKRKLLMEEVLKDRIRISHFSQPSERCPPLAVLHTITGNGIGFKMETKSKDTQISLLHSSCIRDNKTAVMPMGDVELHLVAMYSRNNDREYPCFWGFFIHSGLYDSCLVMLNLRCLGIVFDLDETLIVANTMRSFEDKIEALQRKMSSEADNQRVASMLAEVKRYQDDKNILKQYVDSDQVIDNGKVTKAHHETVPALSDNHPPLVRPLIRLPEKNIILTRINPGIRDTSVLVRLRPAWEDLRSYLTARGRKRFEVYVCTMAERDYALEMWRLLDPESNLISTQELLNRIVCVKSGLRKSLFDVFQDGTCHPKMALVVDDRLKVWDEKDQPRVHVVPAFSPYFAPQAEANNAIPVLCLARNVACNVRGGFFKEFDDGLLQKIPEIAYEDDINSIPPSPDVSGFMTSEEDASVPPGTRENLFFDGMAETEVERRSQAGSSSDAMPASTLASALANLDPRIVASLKSAIASSSIILPATQVLGAQFPNAQLPQVASLLKQFSQASPPEQIAPNSPAREEGEVPESELDPDTRRRLLILQHGQDMREPPSEPPFPTRSPAQVPPPRVQTRGNWFPPEEEISPGHPSRTGPKEYPLDTDMHIKHRHHLQNALPTVESSHLSERMVHENQRSIPEGLGRDDRMRLGHNLSPRRSFFGEEFALNRTPSTSRDFDSEAWRPIPNGESPANVLQDIAMKCGAKVEFRSTLVRTTSLQFSVQAWLAGEKVGEGIGRTRREALHQAAEGSLRHLADIYLSGAKSEFASRPGDANRLSAPVENGYMGTGNSFSNQPFLKDETGLYASGVEPSRLLDGRMDGSKPPLSSIAALRELSMMEGLGVVFDTQPQRSPTSMREEILAQVEVDGQIVGRGVGLTSDEAKELAADRALTALRSMTGPFPHKRQGSSRPLQGPLGKRMKTEFPRDMQRMPSARYRNAPSIP